LRATLFYSSLVSRVVGSIALHRSLVVMAQLECDKPGWLAADLCIVAGCMAARAQHAVSPAALCAGEPSCLCLALLVTSCVYPFSLLVVASAALTTCHVTLACACVTARLEPSFGSLYPGLDALHLARCVSQHFHIFTISLCWVPEGQDS